jgi:hypothetical protein
MTKLKALTVAQLLVLTTAAERPDHLILPLPAKLRVRGGAQRNLLATLLKMGLVEEFPIDDASRAWRTDEADHHLALRLTTAGLAAAGISHSAMPAPGESADPQEPPASVMSKTTAPAAGSEEPTLRPPTGKLGQVLQAISADTGASLSEITTLTNWLPHTARAAVTGSASAAFPSTSSSTRAARPIAGRCRAEGTAMMGQGGAAADLLRHADTPLTILPLSLPTVGTPPDLRLGAALDTLSERVAVLAGLGLEDLRTEWQRLYRSPPPFRVSRDLLQRSIAHRMQEEALGGVSAAGQRQLAASARGLAANGKQPLVTPAAKLKPGTTLVREWHGRTHTVIVLEKGFEHDGKHHTSLTQIAHLITGAHWSGPRFFGLRRASRHRGRGAADGE